MTYFRLICSCGLLFASSLRLLAEPIPEADAIIVPSREVTLSLPAEATLRELRVKEGETVKKGDVLAILYSPMESLEAERANKQRDLAGFHLAVSERLRAGSIVSEESARQEQVDYDISAIDAKRAAAVLDDKTLVAPFGGVILRIYKETGETVGRLEKIIEMVDFATLYVDSYLEAEWLGHVHQGDSVRVRIPQLKNRELTAAVALVDPVVDAGSGLFRVRVVLENPQLEIPSGIPARISFSPLATETITSHAP